MPEHLIALAVGPVQGFIAAARRTRDLWFGSYLLSEVAKAMALCLHEHGAALIFPAKDSDLEPGSDLDVGNKILACARCGDPAKLAGFAQAAGQARWKDLAEDALAGLRKPGTDMIPVDAIRLDMWETQKADVLELAAAWVPIHQDDYATARRRVDRLLAARKSTRDFKPAALTFDGKGFGLPKSSLDGARETVLQRAVFQDPKLKRKLGLGKGEQLDCPALVKRMGSAEGEQTRQRRERFAPLSRIALEAWLEKLPDGDLREFNRQYAALVQADLASLVRLPRYAKLPHDGAGLFPGRLAALSREWQDDEKLAPVSLKARELILGRLKSLQDLRAALVKEYGEPTPYFAILQADGDHMGEFIDQHDALQSHVELTQALTRFAKSAREQVENHRGACVYAGGDDVLALLPVHTALACACALRTVFDQEVRQALERAIGPLGKKPPTLSVGLGLGHAMTPFAQLLDLARRAERLAKNGPEGMPKERQRNALALIVGVRSGAELSLRGRWGEGMEERLARWTALYQENELPDKAAFDLLAAIRQMGWTRELDEQRRRQVLKQEVERVLKKKRAEGGTRQVEDKVCVEILTAVDHAGVESVLGELRLARWLAQKTEERQ